MYRTRACFGLAPLLWALAVIALCVLVWPSSAVGWPGTDTPTILRGFGSSYEAADGTTATHRGCDVKLAEGDEVTSPIAGTVSFVGRVPANTGGTTLACTIAGSDGEKVTLLPLRDARVEAGSAIAAGDTLGTCASAGDGSWPEAHLHVGVRRNGLYVDPAPLLVAAAAAPSPNSSPAEEGANAPAPQSSPSGAGVPAAGAGGVAASSGGVLADTGSAQGAGVTGGQAASAPAGARSAAARSGAAIAQSGAGAAAVDVGGVVLADGTGVSAEQARTSALSGPQLQRPLTGLKRVVRSVREGPSAQRTSSSGVVSALVHAGSRLARTGIIAALTALAGVALLRPVWRAKEVRRVREVKPAGERVATAAVR